MNINPWTPNQAAELREFLQRHPNLLPLLKDRRPKLEHTAESASTAAGYEQALETMESFTQQQSQPGLTYQAPVDVAAD